MSAKALPAIGCEKCKRTRTYVQLCNDCYAKGQAACRFCSGTGIMPMGFDVVSGERRDNDRCGCAAGQAPSAAKDSK